MTYYSVLIVNGSPSRSDSSVSSTFSGVAGGSSLGELSVNNNTSQINTLYHNKIYTASDI